MSLPLPPASRRSLRLETYVTPDEFATVNAARIAAGCGSMAAFVRRLVLAAAPSPTHEAPRV